MATRPATDYNNKTIDANIAIVYMTDQNVLRTHFATNVQPGEEITQT